MAIQVTLDTKDCDYLRKVSRTPQPYLDTQETAALIAAELIVLDHKTQKVSITAAGTAKLASGCP
jgi:hypothetical protein